MSTIFISHSSQDNDIAKDLERRLAEQRHHSVFLDLDPEKGIQAGQSWEQTLYRKLRACRAVICLCTDNYLDSHWCFAEVALARMEGKHLIALKVDPLSPDAKLPAILLERQIIDLRKDSEEGYRRLWNGLQEKDILGKAGDWKPDQPPYLGLSAFQEEDAPVFFGREEETRAGIEMLSRGAPGLIMVLGASGSGKSSLVRAGMVPRLRHDQRQWLVVRPFNPGADPFGELAAALEQAFRRYVPEHAAKVGSQARIKQQLEVAEVRLTSNEAVAAGAEDDSSDVTREWLTRLLDQLQQMKQELPVTAGPRLQNFLDWSLEDLQRICGEPADVAAATRAGVAKTVLTDFALQLRHFSDEARNARVLLVVDQFEELLGHESETHPANAFLSLLRASIEVEHNPLMVLATMRSDFLGMFQRNETLRSIDFESLSLGPMNPEGMRKVIEEPARLGAIELETGLADRLLQDTETPDALPLLSFTLWKLWNAYSDDGKLEIHEYEHLGGLHAAIANEADVILKDAKRQGQEAALRQAFLKMARLSEDGSYARQTVPWEAVEIQEVEIILDRFIKSRLLLTRGEGENRSIQVAHEALFRSWKPLKDWLDDNRANLLLKQQLQRDAGAWADKHDKDQLWRGGRLQQARELLDKDSLPPDEKKFVDASVRRQTRQRWIMGAIAGVVAVALVVFALNAQQSAEKARQFAEKAQRSAEEAQLAADSARRAKTKTVETVLKLAVKVFQDKIDTYRSTSEWGESDIQCAINKNVNEFGVSTKSIFGLLCQVQNIVSLAELQGISELQIYSSGPHQIDSGGYPLNTYAKTEFGHYNPEFVRWAVENLIPSEKMIASLGPVEQVYEVAMKEQARIWYQVYLDLHADPAVLSAMQQRYRKEIADYVDDGQEYDPASPGNVIQDLFSIYASAMLRYSIESGILKDRNYLWREFYRYRTAAGFWLRRELDGTSEIFFGGIEKALRGFDPAFLNTLSQSPIDRVRGNLVGSWISDRDSIVFNSDGSYSYRSATEQRSGTWDLTELDLLKMDDELKKLSVGQPLEIELNDMIYRIE